MLSNFSYVLLRADFSSQPFTKRVKLELETSEVIPVRAGFERPPIFPIGLNSVRDCEAVFSGADWTI